MQHSRLAALGCGLVCFLQLSFVQAEAPVIDLTGRSRSGPTLDERVQKLERILANQTLIDLTMRLDSLQQELSQVIGEMEEAQHQLQDLKNRQKDLYLDLDRRLQQLEKAGGSPAAGAAVPAQSGGGAAQASPEARMAYQKALNVLQSGDYGQAIKQFQGYLKQFPGTEYADDSQYWLGDANFVQRRFKEALVEFQKLVAEYPDSSKYSDALLKIGLINLELGNTADAKKSFKDVISRFPDTPASRIAERRLQQMNAAAR